MVHPAPPDSTSDGALVWLAERREPEDVVRLLVAFRDHLGFDWPSDSASAGASGGSRPGH